MIYSIIGKQWIDYIQMIMDYDPSHLKFGSDVR